MPSGTGPSVYMGCLRADGRERLLLSLPAFDIDGGTVVHEAVVAAPYAALVLDWSELHYGEGESSAVRVFDLRTGTQQPKLGGQEEISDDCGALGDCYLTGIDRLVLGSDGVSAAHIGNVYHRGFAFAVTNLLDVACAPSRARAW